MTAGMYVTMIRTCKKGRVAAGPQKRKTGKQDRRSRHRRAAKPLSAHRFARHHGAGGECRGLRQPPMIQAVPGCRLRCGALGCSWGSP